MDRKRQKRVVVLLLISLLFVLLSVRYLTWPFTAFLAVIIAANLWLQWPRKYKSVCPPLTQHLPPITQGDIQNYLQAEAGTAQVKLPVSVVFDGACHTGGITRRRRVDDTEEKDAPTPA
jgi:hypothetical protein